MDVIDPILRRPTVEQLTGLKRSTIYAGVKAGTFPPPVRLGPNSVGWRQSAIADWLASRELAVSDPGAVDARSADGAV